MSLRSTLAGSLGAVALLAALGVAPSALADVGPSSGGYDDGGPSSDTCSQTSVWESEPSVVEVPGEGEISAIEAERVPDC